MKKLSRTLQAVLVSGFSIFTLAPAFAGGPAGGSGDLARNPCLAEAIQPKGKMKMRRLALLLEERN
ncbi:hypothetical protein C8N36_10314 [Pelagimonas varians]|uniref:Uncharacterized protein n=1 Tax=Pelagimonas varians TaxID=696760 RepID=A0A238KH90_9RHOB|nr:hypothetical protein C8N36_10314 [Pelagimonas varians]SMX42100.1 hypothetical protein PEV8663_02416 [Pelagimonas varians]